MPTPPRRWIIPLFPSARRAARPACASRSCRPRIEGLERRALLSVTIASTNANGNGYAGLHFGQSGGYTPPDTNGAAGPSAYVETVNQEIALTSSKSSGTPNTLSSLSTFWFTTGALPHADSGSGLSDPVVTYDDQIGRFIVGDQDVDFNTHVSRFDLAVSKTSNPGSLGASDWTFYQINTTESGYDADFPGNFGYNHDAFVFTLNMFGSANHVQVVSVNNADLAANSTAPHVYQNDLSDFSVRPTTMHDSVAGDPMWFVTEHGDGKSIDVIKETSVLSSAPTFSYTNLGVSAYSGTDYPLNPNGTVITNNIDSRIQKSAEWNGTIVAAHSVSVSSTQDVIQWYEVDVSSGTPALKDQGRVSGGNNTYLAYPSIDINAAGQIGLDYMRSGNDTSTDYLSMYVTGRDPSDAAGTMETPVLVPAGKGLANYKDFSSGGRAGDLSGINVDPSDHNSFWAANEFADTESTANWSTAIANFTVSSPLPSTDMAVAISGPTSVTAGGGTTNPATYTITITNNGPASAQGVVMTDALPSGATVVSISKTSGSDAFSFAQSGSSETATASGNIASGSSDTFSLEITVPSNLANGSTFTDTASVQASNPDPDTSNNSRSTSASVVNTNSNADVSVGVSGPSSANEGAGVTYTITVTNAGPVDATGVVLTDTLPGLVNYTSASTSQGTDSYSGGTVTFTIGTIGAGSTVTATVSGQAIEDGSGSDSASVTATSPDPNTGNNSASASTSFAEPAISVSGSISTKATTLNNYQVATFTHANGVEPTGAFAATINWGDGTTSTGTVTLSGTTYSVTGSHTYTSRGRHTIATTVVESGNSVNKYGGGDDSKSWKRQDAVQLPSDAHGLGGSGASLSVASAVALAASPTSAVASVPAPSATNSRRTPTPLSGAAGPAGGAGAGIAVLDPSVIAQGDPDWTGSLAPWGTSGAARRQRFGSLSR